MKQSVIGMLCAFLLPLLMTAQSPCEFTPPISCGQTINGHTRDAQNNLDFNNYKPCYDGSLNFFGKDMIYSIDLGNFSTLSDVTINLFNLDNDLDLFVFKNDCAAGQCVGSSILGSTASETVTIENATGIYYIVVDGYTAQTEGRYSLSVECAVECSEVFDDNCVDISYDYAGTDGGLRYYFEVANTKPGGYWITSRIDVDSEDPSSSTEVRIGTTKGIYYTYPTAGVYVICYVYIDEYGCEIYCSKNILINDPRNCELLNKTYDDNTNKWTLEWGDINAQAPEHWFNSTTGQTLGTTTASVQIAAPPAGECHSIKVMYYDTVCVRYGTCITEICTETINPNCCVYHPEEAIWLNNLKTQIEPSCNVESGAAKIKRAKLNGACVYIIQNFVLDDLLTALYDCNGNLLCEQNPLYGTQCNLLNQLTEEITIWECETNNQACASSATGTLTCYDNFFDYIFNVTNNTNEMLLVKFIMLHAGVSFEACYNVQDYLAEPGSNEVLLSFENCFGTIADGAVVTVGVQYIDSNQTICHTEDLEITLGCEDDNGDGDNNDELCIGGNNLVNNGGFEGGYWAFESDLSQACWCKEDSYCIVTDAQRKCTNNGSAAMTNKFLAIEKSVENNQNSLWTQEVAIESGKGYVFAFDLVGFDSSPDVELKLGIAGTVIGTVSSSGDGIQRVGKRWIATYTGTANLQIVHEYQVNPDAVFRFGIDNIEFAACSPVLPNPSVTTHSSTPTNSLSNYPNPFAAQTTIAFQLDEAARANIKVRDTNGRIVYAIEENFGAGQHELPFDGRQLPSGVYFYEIQTPSFKQSNSMIVTK